MAIRFFDMFAGIGGFRSGLEAAGGFECVGFCEIDPYAVKAYRALYDTDKEVYFDDARKIDPHELPDFELLCGGFPCQSFSVAGRRRGFDDTRGTLFFEIARIASVKRPAYLLLENVPGLLSHNEGRTFATILETLDELGYDVAWQVLNSANFLVPQSRNRVFIIGYRRDKRAGQVLSFTDANPKTVKQVIPGTQGERVYDANGLSVTLTSECGGFAGHTGMYLLTPDSGKGCFGVDLNENARVTVLARCVTARYDAGIGRHRGERSGVVFLDKPGDEPRAILTPDRETVRQQGRRFKEPGEPMYTLTAQDRHGIIYRGYIRKLMPLECFRLQGFTDAQFGKLAALGMSDARLYKFAGNAVSVPVITALGERIKYTESLWEDQNAESCSEPSDV